MRCLLPFISESFSKKKYDGDQEFTVAGKSGRDIQVISMGKFIVNILSEKKVWN